jgi:osmotically-inducible protein OsmY
MMQLGIDKFVAAIVDPSTGREVSAVKRMSDLLEEIELADVVGLDPFGFGECHRRDFDDSAPAVMLAGRRAYQTDSPQQRGRRSQRRRSSAHERNREPATGTHQNQIKENDMKTISIDKDIRDAVIRELEWDPRVHTDHVGVSASDGAVVLSGHVPSYLDRWAAAKAAERVYGVRTVADELAVKLPQSSVRDDEDIAEDIARQMQSNTAIPDGVKATVLNGHVTLHGHAEWGYERAEAARSIRHLAGVTGVSNTVAIAPQLPRQTDVDHRVSEAIERMAGLDARSIRVVTATDGTIQLHGVVHTFAERRAAGDAAAAAPGVKDVENAIRVAP